ncbi:RNA-directed DNA polymerase, eukaryota, reverse transcriptase zinc-binding domain protein [Tanacetum coccineum]
MYSLKIDIVKAYDTINWGFLEHVLMQFGIHKNLVRWIMTCVTSVAFSISINGERHGYFKSGRGLRQRDPMSPYLFTLVMEVFSLMMAKKVDQCGEFKFHKGCKELKITHLSFADDLLVLNHGDARLVKAKNFEDYDFKVGSLPVKYLGIPSITKKLGINDCKELVDKVKRKVNDWKNKALSYAGRLQLIASVLASMQTYWALICA